VLPTLLPSLPPSFLPSFRPHYVLPFPYLPHIILHVNFVFFQDRGILSQSFSKQTEVGYILSLGVSKDHRRNGIASLLLDNLISHLTTVEHVDCKALFLHVLTTNSPAIHFYEHRNFRYVKTLVGAI
jgi:Acetyltransferases